MRLVSALAFSPFFGVIAAIMMTSTLRMYIG